MPKPLKRAIVFAPLQKEYKRGYYSLRQQGTFPFLCGWVFALRAKTQPRAMRSAPQNRTQVHMFPAVLGLHLAPQGEMQPKHIK
jgi:hypothetical protein